MTVLPQTVFGLGSGRSGTYSLYKLFQAQFGFRATHEGFLQLNWDTDLISFWRGFYEWISPHTGDDYYEITTIANVGFYWIKYISNCYYKEKQQEMLPRLYSLKISPVPKHIMHFAGQYAAWKTSTLFQNICE